VAVLDRQCWSWISFSYRGLGYVWYRALFPTVRSWINLYHFKASPIMCIRRQSYLDKNGRRSGAPNLSTPNWVDWICQVSSYGNFSWIITNKIGLPTEAKDLVKRLGGLLLALAQAGAFIKSGASFND
jgi:hypothetical protein